MQRYLAVLGLVALACIAVVTFPPAAAMVLQAINLAPGDALTISCSTSLSGDPAGQQATFTCAPLPPAAPADRPSAPGGGPVGGGGGGGGPAGGPPVGVPNPPASSNPPPMTTPPAPTQTSQEATTAEPPTVSVEVAAAVASVPAENLADSLTLDPTDSGRIALPGAQVVLTIPAAATQDVFTVRISAVDPSLVLPAGEGFDIGGTLFEVSAADSNGDLLATFDRPLAAVVQPSADDLTAVFSDVTRLVLAVQDLETAAWQILPTSVADDGGLAAWLDRPAVYALLHMNASVGQADAPP